MNITGVDPDPVPAGRLVTITFAPGVATGVIVTLNNVPVAVPWKAAGPGAVIVGPFPEPGNYQVQVTNDLNNSATTPVASQ